LSIEPGLITRRLKETLSLLEARVFDRLIIADAQEYSFAETWLLWPGSRRGGQSRRGDDAITRGKPTCPNRLTP
jgi:RadC-like JAB domain-containing protein